LSNRIHVHDMQDSTTTRPRKNRPYVGRHASLCFFFFFFFFFFE